MGTPKAPNLPANLPPDLRKFLMCESTSVTIADGPMPWIEGSPPISIKPGATPGTATLETEIMGATVSVPASIKDGALSIDYGWKASFLPAGAKAFADDLNAWFKSNGYQWGPPTFGKGTTTLTKVLLPVTFTAKPPQPGSSVVDGPVTPMGVDAPGSSVYGSDADKAVGPTQPYPYVETKVDAPGMPTTEVFKVEPGKAPLEDIGTGSANPMTGKPFVDNSEAHQVFLGQQKAAQEEAKKQAEADRKAAEQPRPATTPVPGAAVTGAGGPGGPKSPAGMGRLAVYAVVAVIVAVIGGVVLFGGGGKPAASQAPGGSQVAGGSPGASASSGAVSPTQAPQAACAVSASLRKLGFAPVNETDLCAIFMPDGMRDFFEYNGTAVQLAAEEGDITEARIGTVEVDTARRKMLMERCGVAGSGLRCGSLPIVEGMYTVFVLTSAGSIEQEAGAFYEYALGLNDTTPGNGVGKTPYEGAAADPLRGSTLAYSQRFPSVTSGTAIPGPFRLTYDKDSTNRFFFEGPSAVFTYVDGPYMFFFVPVGELDGVTTFRAFSFLNFDDASGQGVDLWPNYDLAPAELPADIPLL